MMYANIRGADGQMLGSVAIDPTAPGGLQGQLNSAVQSLQTPRGAPAPGQGRPIPPGYMPSGAYQSQPTSQSQAFICQLRYMARGPNGQVQWATRSINCPVGLPPGVYFHTPGH